MAELDWTHYIRDEDVNIPLHALGYSCTERISWFLNTDVLLRPGMRHKPNFGGLGELIGLDGLEIGEMSRRENAGLAILDLWKERIDLNPTVGNLVKYLAELGRSDILTDCKEWIRDEIDAHRERQKNFEIQSETVSSADTIEDANRILTIDDVMEGKAVYDAFITYDTKDIDFVKAMIAMLEDPRKYGFRFFVPGRNNLVGTNSYALTTKIISERCRHMIVVLSKGFLDSPACEFQSTYAFALNPGARDKKIIPIKIEDCRIPNILQIMACCDFTNSNLLDWCWKRLAMSLMCPMPNPEFIGTPRFVPPQGSALARTVALAELGASSSTSSMSQPESGYSSWFPSSQNKRSAATAPVNIHGSSQSLSSNSSDGMAASQTAPVPSKSSSPSPLSQAFKRISQTLTPSKNQKKKHKSTGKDGEEQDSAM